jgi:hypothetical protein
MNYTAYNSGQVYKSFAYLNQENVFACNEEALDFQLDSGMLEFHLIR